MTQETETPFDPSTVRGIEILVDCWLCAGKGSVPGGQREYGELVPCAVCNGRGTTRKAVPLALLYDLLFGNLRPGGADPGKPTVQP